MTVLVCGGRDYNHWRRLHHVLDVLHHRFHFDKMITGGAPGADTLADDWATVRGVDHRTVKADWMKFGKGAGPLRNQQMLDEEHPDLCVVFPGANGTTDMRDRAQLAGVQVIHEWSVP
jgi:hypothetical protein